MKRLRNLALHFLLLVLAHSVLAGERPVMTWIVQDYPPVMMPVDGQMTVGTVDTQLKLIARDWPEVEHRYIVANYSRLLHSLENGEEVCAGNILASPERERIAYFSEAQFSAPIQVIARSGIASQLPVNDSGEVVPEDLINAKNLRGLISRNRSYTEPLDSVLNSRLEKSNISYVSMANGGTNILQMLASDRGDYTFDYDYALAYQRSRHPALFKDAGLRAFPIAGVKPIISVIACPRTPWGRAAIRKIDSLIAKQVKTREYLEASDRWVTAETRTRYFADREAFINQRARTSNEAKYK